MKVVEFINGDQPGVVVELSHDELHTIQGCCVEAAFVKAIRKQRRVEALAYANVLDQLGLRVGFVDRQGEGWTMDQAFKDELSRIKAEGIR